VRKTVYGGRPPGVIEAFDTEIPSETCLVVGGMDHVFLPTEFGGGKCKIVEERWIPSCPKCQAEYPIKVLLVEGDICVACCQSCCNQYIHFNKPELWDELPIAGRG